MTAIAQLIKTAELEDCKVRTLFSIFAFLFLIPVICIADSRGANSQSVVIASDKEKLSQATDLHNKGAYDEASSILLDLIASNPNYYQPYYNLGVTLALRGDYFRSEKYLEHAISIGQAQGINNAKAFNALGWVNFKQYKYEDAERSYLRGIQVSGDDGVLRRRLHTNLGSLYYVTGDFIKARKFLSVAYEQYESESSRKLLMQIDELEQKQITNVATKTIELSIEDGEYIGQKVWLNEGGGKLHNLVNWNTGEEHASVGIGHFIWYPKNQMGPYTETFPELITIFEENGVVLPQWLKENRWCPWESRTEMIRAKNAREKKYLDLIDLLSNTTPYQVEYMVKRLNDALPLILRTIQSDVEKRYVEEQFYRVSHHDDGTISADGIYALLDYVNFKGEGTNKAERYNNQGWGLLQVLSGMAAGEDDPLLAFINSAKSTLSKRIENAPEDRNEEKWRKGWFSRIDTYSRKLTNP